MLMRRRIAIVCFFLSGAAGLIDEVVWIKRASLVFGSTTFALSTVLAVFFAGLALGSEIFGRIGHRIARPIRVYALLELALAAMALLSLRAFGWLEAPYGMLYRSLAEGSDLGHGGSLLLIAARVGLVAVVLLPPTVAMGGTLPLFVRQFMVSGDRLSSRVGFLYGINTLGAAVGTAAAGFLLLPALGLQGTIMVAAALNIVAGGLALRLRLEADVPNDVPNDDPNDTVDEASSTQRTTRRLRVVAGLFLLTGLTALAAEVVWSRFLSLMVRNSVTTYTLALAVVLVGIVIGSWLAARLWDRRVPLVPAFASLQAGAGLVLLALTGLSADFWLGLGGGIMPFVLLMLPPAILSGASFPLAVKLAATDGADVVRTVGRLTALNTVGGIVGSLAAGFWLLPGLGLAVSLKIVTGLSVAAAVLALLLVDRPQGRRVWIRGAGAASAVVVWFLIPTLTPATLPDDYVSRSGVLLDAAEGYGSTLSVVLRDGSRQLLIDRLWQGKDAKSHQIVAAHVPALLHPAPHDVLVIGLGVGQTASRFLMHGATHLDCVDIEPAIFEFVRRNFDSAWMDDPRVTLIPDDGRTYTAHTSNTYDIVSIEVGQVFRPGVDAFYTREFYAEARERLNPGGLVAQFVPLPFLGETEFRRILGTFLETFPEAVLWYNLNELLLIGSADAPVTLGVEALRRLEVSSALQADLAWSHWGGVREHLADPTALLGGYLCGAEELAALAADAEPLVDDVPDLAYATMNVDTDSSSEVPLAALLRTHLSEPTTVLGSGVVLDAEGLAFAIEVREGNLRDLVVGAQLRVLHGRLNELGPDGALLGVERALKIQPENRSARRMKGEILNLAGRFDEALPLLEQVVAREPVDHDARRALALALSRSGRLDEAVRHLRTLLQDVPADAQAHTMLGACYADQGRFSEARDQFREAIRLNPQDDSTRTMLRQVEGTIARSSQ